MTSGPQRADADTMARRAELATAVRDDLSAAGLPVVPEGADSSVSAGAQVAVDALDDDLGGVFVDWGVGYVLGAAAMDAVCEGRGPDDPSIRLSAATKRAMRDAIAEILTIAGYDVRKDVDDMAPYRLQVLSRRPEPSWRYWLREQTARRDALRAAARARKTPTE